MKFERIAYLPHAYKRMRERRITPAEVKEVLNTPEVTYPSKDKAGRIIARGCTQSGRRILVVYTEEHDRDADVLVITVIDAEG